MIPKNRQAELAVIGSIIADHFTAASIRKYIKPEMFYHTETKEILLCALELADQGVPVEIVTLSDELRRRDKYDFVGGSKTLSSCIDAVVNSSHAEHYAKIVAACYYEREIINLAGELAKTALTKDSSQSILNRIRDTVLAKEGLTAPMTMDYTKDLVSFCESLGSKKSVATTKTGIELIDRAWSGTRGGEVNVWGAATNVGKSLMLMNLMHLAAKSGKRCLYVGTEMTAHETAQRHLSVVSGFSAKNIRSGNIDMGQMAELHGSIINEMAKMPVHIFDAPEPNIEQIEAVISSTKAEIVYLDYLERFSLPREESMRLRVREFMRKVKSMARRHDVEVHLAAQLNRTTYGTEEKRPSLADLSESSAVEKEADRVMLLWRPKMKQPTTGYHSLIECIQAKNRHSHMGLPFDLLVDNANLRITCKGEDF